MGKFLLLTVILYYIYTKFLQPISKIEKQRNENQDKQNNSENNHSDEYVDYEEVN